MKGEADIEDTYIGLFQQETQLLSWKDHCRISQKTMLLFHMGGTWGLSSVPPEDSEHSPALMVTCKMFATQRSRSKTLIVSYM